MMRVTGTLFKRVIPYAAISALSGCIPLPFNYYLPTAPSGTLEAQRGECNDVQDVIVFSFPEQGVRLKFHAFASSKGSDSLEFSIQKSSRTYQTLANADGAKTHQADWSAVKANAIDFAADHATLVDSTGKTKDLPLQLTGDKGTRLLLSADRFGRSFALPQTVNAHFDIDMPAIRVDGTVLNVPRIHFTRKSVTAMTGINC
jgi:hypothetical protein